MRIHNYAKIMNLSVVISLALMLLIPTGLTGKSDPETDLKNNEVGNIYTFSNAFLSFSCEIRTFEGYTGWDPNLYVCDIYATFDDPNDAINAVWGFTDTPLHILTDAGQFFQSSAPAGHGDTAPDESTLGLPGYEENNWDSFVTIGVLADDGTDVTSLIGFDSDGFNNHGDITITNGAWFASDPDAEQCFPDEDGRVLIGQFTVDRTLATYIQGIVNIQFASNQQVIGAEFYFEVSLPCPGDANGDGFVNIDDIFFVLGHWGETGGPADVNQDGTVNIDDIFFILAHWGPCA